MKTIDIKNVIVYDEVTKVIKAKGEIV